MASSDEEGEILPQHVSNYYFQDNNGTHVCFSVLPFQWEENEAVAEPEVQVYLRGSFDGGLQRIYKRVIAWRFDLSYTQPDILVLSKDKNWIKLVKPQKSLENIFRSVLVTVHCLHFFKRNPYAPRHSVWSHLSRTFSAYEVGPSEKDLLDNMQLIMEAVSRDKDLAHMMPKEDAAFQEDVQKTKKSSFIDDDEQDLDIDDDDDDDDIGDDADDEIGDDGGAVNDGDTVCAICDEGGNMLSCTGMCLRSFHPKYSDGVGSRCVTLGFRTAEEVEAIPNFLCKNCLYKQHQCFACGSLGSSAGSSGQEVFRCCSATCGHFYHPNCVTKLLHIGNESQSEALQRRIAGGEPFICPAHKCFVCKQVEDKDVDELRFALCRRCPRAYHKKCLPKCIIFQNDGVNLQRAWEGLLPNKRILIYCMKHKIDRVLETPVRDHLIFPNYRREKKKHVVKPQTSKGIVAQSKRTMTYGNFAPDRTAVKKLKVVEKSCDSLEMGGSSKQTEKRIHGEFCESPKKQSLIVKCRNSLKDSSSSASCKSEGNMNLGPYPLNSKPQNMANCKSHNTVSINPLMKRVTKSQLANDEAIKRGIVALMNDADASIDVEEFLKRQNVPSTYAKSKNAMKSITLGLVEGSLKAVQVALQKLQDGCSIEDVKTVCDPETLIRIFRWQKMLKVYLSPFLHGKRYTSFGRHFTQVEKLKEIVNQLHHYVEDGDMVVDFCCGSNDFSCLMRDMLEKTGKSCLFKNFDIIKAKNEFCFEQRDWMSVGLDELPDGSRLIMGLNPPFGTKASLANQFVRKALTFKPKLIVLIVPEETKRLDTEAPYHLIWKNDILLSGKSFYLPGSVDVNDKQMDDWNLKAPPLYLWSRADWTDKHIAIAREQGHKPEVQNGFEHLTNENCDNNFCGNMYAHGGTSSIFDTDPNYSRNIAPEFTKANIPREQREGYFLGCGGGDYAFPNYTGNIGPEVTRAIIHPEQREGYFPNYTGNIRPELTRATIHGEQKEGNFPGCGSNEPWENGNVNQHCPPNLTEMHNGNIRPELTRATIQWEQEQKDGNLPCCSRNEPWENGNMNRHCYLNPTEMHSGGRNHTRSVLFNDPYRQSHFPGCGLNVFQEYKCINAVPNYAGNIRPELTRAAIQWEQKEGNFPGCSTREPWVNDNMSQHYLTEMHKGDRNHTESVLFNDPSRQSNFPGCGHNVSQEYKCINAVPNYVGNRRPELSRATIQCEQKDGNFPGCSRSEPWENGNMNQHFPLNPTEMHNGGRNHAESVLLNDPSRQSNFPGHGSYGFQENCINHCSRNPNEMQQCGGSQDVLVAVESDNSSPIDSPDINEEIERLLEDLTPEINDVGSLTGKQEGVKTL